MACMGMGRAGGGMACTGVRCARGNMTCMGAGGAGGGMECEVGVEEMEQAEPGLDSGATLALDERDADEDEAV